VSNLTARLDKALPYGTLVIFHIVH